MLSLSFHILLGEFPWVILNPIICSQFKTSDFSFGLDCQQLLIVVMKKFCHIFISHPSDDTGREQVKVLRDISGF
jgi:hypothetical protein